VISSDPEQSWRQVREIFDSAQRSVWEWIGASPSQKNGPVIIRGGKVENASPGSMVIGSQRPVQQGGITGRARVIDGDTLAIGDLRFRLNGIDAEEMSERNGPAAKRALERAIGSGAVRCVPNGQTTYNRQVATCYSSSGADLAREVIGSGYALDCGRYSGGQYRGSEPPGARQRLKQKPYC
jgi:micrococcal nuclease